MDKKTFKLIVKILESARRRYAPEHDCYIKFEDPDLLTYHEKWLEIDNAINQLKNDFLEGQK